MPTIYLDVLLLQGLYVNYFFAACCGKTDAYAFALDTVRTGSGGEQPVFLLILLPPLPAWFQLVCKLLAAALSVAMAFGLHRRVSSASGAAFSLQLSAGGGDSRHRQS